MANRETRPAAARPSPPQVPRRHRSHPGEVVTVPVSPPVPVPAPDATSPRVAVGPQRKPSRAVRHQLTTDAAELPGPHEVGRRYGATVLGSTCSAQVVAAPAATVAPASSTCPAPPGGAADRVRAPLGWSPRNRRTLTSWGAAGKRTGARSGTVGAPRR
ncbi:hypothetical protein C1701_18945 [Actinoalloteichus sp. AHMU CJ021]|nr:hypothetical protein C1701_18945 [Actinoalloteichus sp. AHMU CJ021]